MRTHEALPSASTFGGNSSAIAFNSRGYLSPLSTKLAKVSMGVLALAGLRITPQAGANSYSILILAARMILVQRA